MAKTAKAGKIARVVGFVDLIDEYDDEAGIKISTDEDEEYVVEMNRQGRRLADYMGEEVEVFGTVTEDKDGTLSMSVTKFEVLEYDEEEEDSFSYDE